MKKIFVKSDDISFQQMLYQEIKRSDNNIIHSDKSGLRLNEMIKKVQPDLIILTNVDNKNLLVDLYFTRQLNIPIIAIFENGVSNFFQSMAYKNGASEVYVKPLFLENISYDIEKFLNKDYNDRMVVTI